MHSAKRTCDPCSVKLSYAFIMERWTALSFSSSICDAGYPVVSTAIFTDWTTSLKGRPSEVLDPSIFDDPEISYLLISVSSGL